MGSHLVCRSAGNTRTDIFPRAGRRSKGDGEAGRGGERRWWRGARRSRRGRPAGGESLLVGVALGRSAPREVHVRRQAEVEDCPPGVVPGDGQDHDGPDDDPADRPLRDAQAQADRDGVEPRLPAAGEDGPVVARGQDPQGVADQPAR